MRNKQFVGVSPLMTEMTSRDDRIDELFRMRRRLEADLRDFGRSEEDARELAQIALIETWKKIDRVQLGAEWVYVRTAARRLAINQATRNREGVSLEDAHPAKMADQSPSPEAKLIADEQQKQFNTAFAELPADSQQALILRQQGQSYKQIAKKLGVPMTAVQSRLYRAARFLRTCVGAPPPGVHWLDLPGDDEHDHEE